MPMKISKFHRGSSTFPCNVCTRLTRDTGVQSAGNRICPQCFELAGIENEISDGHSTRAENLETIQRLVTEVQVHGGDITDWKEVFSL